MTEQKPTLPRWPTPRYITRTFGSYLAVAAVTLLAFPVLAAIALGWWKMMGDIFGSNACGW